MIKKLLITAIAALTLTSCASFAQTPKTSSPSQALSQTLKAELLVTNTGRVNKFGNPILEISVVTEQGVLRSYLATSGRGYTQNRNRHQAGTEAPLPNGRYRLGSIHKGPFSARELGTDYFVDAFPMFSTGRTELGLHLDPSYNADPKEDGTAGCLGLVSNKDLQDLVRYIRQHNIRIMTVDI